MRSIVISSVFLMFSVSSIACRYGMMEQNGRYYIYKQVRGDLPQEDEKISSDLMRGIRDVKIEKKKKDQTTDATDEQKDNSQSNEDEEISDETSKTIRIKVRFDTDNKEEAERYLKIRCREQ